MPGSAWALSCAASPDAAVRQWVRQQAGPASAAEETFEAVPGYVVERTNVDTVLGTEWALVVDCMHPERPPMAVAMPAGHISARHMVVRPSPRPAVLSSSIATPRVAFSAAMSASSVIAPSSRSIAVNAVSPVLVRAGDAVVLWNQEPQLRMEIAAVALEYGHAGQVIHLRRSGGIATPATTMTGVVRAAGSVELMP